MQTLMQSEGMYNFALFLQFMSMLLQPIMYIVGIVALIFVIRALMVYTKKNKPEVKAEIMEAMMAEGSVFGEKSVEELAEMESAEEAERSEETEASN